MDQKTKNIALIIAILVLTGTAALLYFSGGPSRKVDFDETKFTIADTSRIHKIVIKGNSFTNTLQDSAGTWMVNHKYPLDPSMKKVLMAVLNRVRIHRKAPKNLKDSIARHLEKNGYRVSIYDANDLMQSYLAGGNDISVSYFMGDDGEPYVVHLPGYNSYVSGIFEVSENDWRDRFVFSTSWMGIKKLALDYTDDKDKSFIIRSGAGFPNVEGINKPDTSRLMQYINLFHTFAVDQYLDSGRVARYDSLSLTKPWAILTVDAISLSSPCVVKFFPRLPGDRLLVGRLNENQIVLFSYDRIKEIFKTKSWFGKP